MTVERMTMINVVGKIENVNGVAKDIVLLGNVDIVNALNEIKESHFTLSVVEENVDELIDMSLIKPFKDETDYDEASKKLKSLKEILGNSLSVNRKSVEQDYNFPECIEEIDKIYDEVINLYNSIKNLEDELKQIDEFKRNFSNLKNLDIRLEDLTNLQHFSYAVGILTKEDRLKLKKNYENITAIVLHTGSSDSGEVYLVISPKDLEVETNRILRSLNFNRIEISDDYKGTPKEIVKELEEKERNIREKLYKLKSELSEMSKKYEDYIDVCYSRLVMEEKIKHVKSQMVSTKNFFYLSGWIPERDKEIIRDTLSKYKDLIIVCKNYEDNKDGFKPPTKLRNNNLFSPFEFLVKMYGIPSYNELDPTVFLSLTYMLLFGAMFGDLGQGFILLLIGILLKRKMENLLFGAILNRLGISSMIFGVLYGSVFGFEDVIPAFLIKPYENINFVLYFAVGIGVFLLLISYIYSIINSFKQKNLKEGLFGRNGIAGLCFYVMLLILLGSYFMNKTIIPEKVGLWTLVILILIMIGKEPLSNLLFNKRPLYNEPPSSYYIESGFDMLETLLSMLSSTVSFIRVGAFALTHVGLFLAFETIAELLGSFSGSAIVLILGNIVIIGLEGLIVSIQGLRLEYYELFSRYYKGEGVEFNPVKLE